jgi:type I restriction enzyme M protein
MPDAPDLALANSEVAEAIARGFIEISGARVKYNLAQKREYDWTDPEEWVRARSIAHLIISKNYPANRIKTEVVVPRRTPNDSADIVVYKDDRCTSPYLVVENKAAGQVKRAREQGIEQLFGNANSLRVPYGLYDEWDEHILFDVQNFPPTERRENVRGGRLEVPLLYGETPVYPFHAGERADIAPVQPAVLETKIRRSHSIIWAGGKRDPLLAFDEWSKLLFAKVVDERNTPTGQPRGFQVGTHETVAAVANRVHRLFAQGCQDDPALFPPGTRINLPDRKIFDVVSTLQAVSLVGTDVDAVGSAFENFYGSIFRGQLGQYFTMRQIARFTVALLDISHEHYVIDPTAGSGGFLLEALLQVWHAVDQRFHGQAADQVIRIKNDFALLRVYGIEIHDILSRICKINLLLHHDGHTHIEGDRSCLDSTFTLPRLQEWPAKFDRVVGNPPFGDEVEEGDDDLLGTNSLRSFEVAQDRDGVASEHVIVERAVDMLNPGGRFGLVLPDGLFNNQGAPSNCPRMRHFLATRGHIEAIVSLPDFAFRKSGAQNKTSILFFRKFNREEKVAFDRLLGEIRTDYREQARREAEAEAQAEAEVQAEAQIQAEVEIQADADGQAEEQNESEGEDELEVANEVSLIYGRAPFNGLRTFLAEANHIGYTPAGVFSQKNDLYSGTAGGRIDATQFGTILGEWQAFRTNPSAYAGRQVPDCMALPFAEMWDAHPSHRIDPKYHVFKRTEHGYTPEGWVRVRVGDAMQRREDEIDPSTEPDRMFSVMTISQKGEIRPREAGKGRNPPEWLGMYFENGSSRWFQARSGDVVYSSIDLWKGCIAVVPPEFDGAIVTNEFPIFEVIDTRLDAEFLSYLLRARYYQRAFRAITTGHSNRRRTQQTDFENLEICFPPAIADQQRITVGIRAARQKQRDGVDDLVAKMTGLSNLADGREGEELPDVVEDAPENDED